MVRTQIYPTKEEKAGLGILAKSSGKKQPELIREAVLDQAAGMWKDREDLPDFDAARSSWGRS